MPAASVSAAQPVAFGDLTASDGEIAGDLSIAGANVDWGDAATVGGTILYYAEDADDVNVPESVPFVSPCIRNSLRSCSLSGPKRTCLPHQAIRGIVW